MKYKILAKDGRAKRADVETVHGTIHTPVFMNVGTHFLKHLHTEVRNNE